MTIAVIIPTFRREAQVKRLVTTLFEGGRSPDEVIIVDNDPAASCHASWPSGWPVRIVCAGLGLNLAGARNRGWRLTDADLCVFIDDDNFVAPNTLEVLNKGASGLNVGLVAPIIYETGRPSRVWCGGVRRSMWTTRTHFLHRGSVELPDAKSWSTDDMPDVLAIPRKVLEEVAGFDEVHFPFHYDEADIAERIRRLGLQSIVLRDASVWHSGGPDTDPGIEMFRAFEISGSPRVQFMAYARAYFHRRHATRTQRITALGLFIPVWALMVAVACMRQRKPIGQKRDVILAILVGLIRGYTRKVPGRRL